MTSKERSAQLFNQFKSHFHCPLCKTSIEVVENRSLTCKNKHTFDFAKQGYVNLLTRPASSNYDKALFEARHKIITESNLYKQLHRKISEITVGHASNQNQTNIVFDAGCGEGSHLHKILEQSTNTSLLGVGLDISKEGIRMAASKYKESIWLVGDLANSPIVDHSCQIILNILSPANYKEFKRILAPNGLLIKVVPRPEYLKELREVLFLEADKKTYTNDETVSLFREQFQLENCFTIRSTEKLSSGELSNLVQMTPLGWNSNQEQLDAFMRQQSASITIDLDILVGVNK